MAKNNSSPAQKRAWNTQVFLKQCMAVSGTFFVIFVLFHSYGNLKILAGPEAYTGYAHHLRVFLTPILPYEGLLWIMRVVLVALVLIHMGCAGHLWVRGRRARGASYDKKKNVVQNYAARTMMYGGIYLTIFIIFHILHFTVKAIKIGDAANYGTATIMVDHEQIPAAPWNMMVTTFSPDNWWAYLIYIVAVGCLGMHVAHGVWSALQTLGWLRGNTRRFVVPLSGLVGAAVFLMFAIPPTYLMIVQPAPVGL